MNDKRNFTKCFFINQTKNFLVDDFILIIFNTLTGEKSLKRLQISDTGIQLKNNILHKTVLREGSCSTALTHWAASWYHLSQRIRRDFTSAASSNQHRWLKRTILAGQRYSKEKPCLPYHKTHGHATHCPSCYLEPLASYSQHQPDPSEVPSPKPHTHHT